MCLPPKQLSCLTSKREADGFPLRLKDDGMNLKERTGKDMKVPTNFKERRWRAKATNLWVGLDWVEGMAVLQDDQEEEEEEAKDEGDLEEEGVREEARDSFTSTNASVSINKRCGEAPYVIPSKEMFLFNATVMGYTNSDWMSHF